jgi:hypothetical protein
MTDMSSLVAAIASTSNDTSPRLRQGVIQSVAANGTATVTIAGSALPISGVKVASNVCPVPTATCWLMTDGRDWFVIATLAPAGPAYGTMRKGATQAIPTSTFTELTWATRTDTQAVGTTLGSTGITVVVPGLYNVTANITLDANTTGNRVVRMLKNGNVEYQGNSMVAPGSTICRMSTGGIIKCAIGDVLNVEVWQNTGANLATDLTTGSNRITATWVGPVA